MPWDGYGPLDIKAKVIKGERPAVPRTMPYACESLLRKLWHQTAAQRPDFDAALAAVHGVHDALPLGSEMAARAPMDSLDDFAALSLRPQRR